MDDSVCVVARHADLGTACLGHKSMPKHEVMKALTKAIVSEVEGIPYDRDLYERLGLIICKPFGVVSVFPAVGNSWEDDAKRDEAIDFLMETVNESVITCDDAIKTTICAFDRLFPQELKAEEYSVTALKGCWCDASNFTVPMIEKHLAGLNKKTGKTYEQLAVVNIGFKKAAKTDEKLAGINIGFGISAVTLLFLISRLFY